MITKKKEMNISQTNRDFLPDPAHPGTFITQSVLPGPAGKIVGNAVEKFCDHNPCPEIEIHLPEIHSAF